MELISYADQAVRLVNTATPGRPGTDALADLPALRAWLTPHLADHATEEDLADLRELRARLREVFDDAVAGDSRATVDRLNALMRAHPVHPQISGHDDSDWHLHLTESGCAAEQYAAGAVTGLAVLVTTLGVDRLGTCDGSGCRDVYVDVSRNRSRRYCSDRCASRANVAAYRARKRARAG